MGSLVPVVTGGAPPKPTPITLDVQAGDFYRACMGRGGAVPSAFPSNEAVRARLVLKWFNAMSTDDEKERLVV